MGEWKVSKVFLCSIRTYLMKPTHWRRREMKKAKYGTFGRRRRTDNEPRSIHKSHVMRTKMKFGSVSIRVRNGRGRRMCGDAVRRDERTYVKNWNRKLKVKSKSLCNGIAGNWKCHFVLVGRRQANDFVLNAVGAGGKWLIANARRHERQLFVPTTFGTGKIICVCVCAGDWINE